MPRRSPPPLDAERVRALLAAGPVTDPSAHPSADDQEVDGWLPEAAPPDADTSWAHDPPELPPEEERPEQSAGRHRPTPRVLTVPVAFRGARLSVSWRAVLAMALLLVVAGLLFAVRVARAEQTSAPEAVGPSGGLVARTAVPSAFASSSSSPSPEPVGPSSGAGGARGSPSGLASSPSSNRLLVIDVVGQVAHPGVVSVADGARVSDVLTAAGGALPSADIQRLNLARLVTDGEQVFVPKPGESQPAPVGVVGGGGAPASIGPGSASGSGSVGSGPVDLNTATLADLDALPGVGPVLAQRILDWRTAHGRFSAVDELGEVSGIGDKLLTQIRPKVRV